MPKKPAKKTKKSGSKKIPSYGRSQKHVQRDMGLRKFSSDVPLGNNDPTMVHGKMYGGMPNKSRKATGGMRVQRGRRG